MLKVGKAALDVFLVSMSHLDKHMKMKKCKKKNSAMSWLERQADQLKKKKRRTLS